MQRSGRTLAVVLTSRAPLDDDLTEPTRDKFKQNYFKGRKVIVVVVVLAVVVVVVVVEKKKKKSHLFE